jgi:hypothetical protein
MLMYRSAVTPVEEELTQAVRRVVNQYGNDLTAYFRHVEEMAKKNAQESSETVDSANESDTESHS